MIPMRIRLPRSRSWSVSAPMNVMLALLFRRTAVSAALVVLVHSLALSMRLAGARGIGEWGEVPMSSG